MNWHYSKNGQIHGPADSAALGGLIQGGDLGGNDLVWREGWAEWRVLEQVEELAHHLQSNRKSTPPPLPVGGAGNGCFSHPGPDFRGNRVRLVSAADGLHGFTSESVSIRRGSTIYIYDERGNQTGCTSAR
jgi:hypothetical protein